MRNHVLAISAICTVLFSCNKEEKPAPSDKNVEAAAYYPMSVGSYWIYENYSIDTNGVETNLGRLDSVFIASDTIINGKTYFNIESNPISFLNQIVRDSSGYLITPDGLIHFAPNDFTDPLEIYTQISGGDTIYTMSSKMEKEQSLTVPAGTFKVLALLQVYEVFGNVPNPHREYRVYRAPDVGIVLFQTGMTTSANTLESRLVRYHIN